MKIRGDEKPMIIVVIATYNLKELLPKAVDSILNQA
jgi:glycosyltransferase involved in cell wall biosynthesis